MSESAVEQLMPFNSDGSVYMEDLKTLARNNITLAKLVEKQGSACLEVLEKLQKATDVAVTGVSVHGNLIGTKIFRSFHIFQILILVGCSSTVRSD